MNDKIEMSEEQLINLIRKANQEKPALQKVFTTELLSEYIKSHTLTTASRKLYNIVCKRFSAYSPLFPDTSKTIETYLTSLTNETNGKPASYMGRRSHLRVISMLLHFAIKRYSYPDYSQDLPKMSDHDPHAPERLIMPPEELMEFLNRIPDGHIKLIFLTLIDSGCRIGELGYTNEHSGLTIDHIYPEQEIIEVSGKTGTHKMHCSAELCDILIQNASPTGAIFHSKRSPDGYRSDTLTSLVRWYFDKYSNLTSKRGAHTIRHSIGTFLADISGKPLLVQNFLKHSKIDMSMKYIHLAESRKNKLPSPLKLMHADINSRHQQPKQTIMISDGSQPPTDETALAIVNPLDPPVERVEATMDLSEQMFRQVPHLAKPIHITIDEDYLNDMREAYLFVTRNYPTNSALPGRLSRRFNMQLKKVKPI